MSGPTSLVSGLRNMIGISFLLMIVGAQARTLYVIDIGFETSDVTLAQKLSVLSCQGLMNRKSDEEVAVYSLKDGWDQLWLDTVLEQDPDWVLLPLTINEFLSDVCEREKFPKLLYSKSTHHEMIPQIITVAGALSAIPLDIDTSMDQMVSWEDHEVVFNAEIEFLGFTELEATTFIFDHYANITTGVAMMNPGWRAPDDLHPIQNELVRDPDVGLADYIIKERIFNFFLWSGCLPGTEQHELMRRMMSDENTRWEKPVEVYGYNDAIVIFGDIFEAETNCVREHNMGQVASSGQNNFSFFSRKSAIQSPEDLEKYLEVLLQTRQDIADGKIAYDPTKTYLSLIVGDGDNTAFMKGSRRGWMTDRLKYCEENGGCDFPLCLSMSPHLMYLAPHLLYWYYQKANQTQQDVFVLPPSGHLYAYPGMMDDEVVQNSFIQSTQEDCRLLSTTSSVHWEWFFGWPQAFSNYFPKYATSEAENSSNDDVEEHNNKQESDNCVKSFFATNVPYNFLTPIVWNNGHFHMFDGDVVVFKPREWRGTNKDNIPPFAENNYLTEEEMAAEINEYEKGSVTHLYLTSDGGMNLPTLYKMIGLLEDHVKIVNHEELTEMARQRVSHFIL